MTVEKFDEEVDKVCTSIKDVLSIKAKEYRRNDNPLHNFDVGTQQSTSGETREDVIWGMARKHFISVQDIKNDVKLGKIPNREILDEKYGDLINYLILEKASILDKIVVFTTTPTMKIIPNFTQGALGAQHNQNIYVGI